MSSRPINKAASDFEWESHKDTIKSLFLTENLKLTGPAGLIAYMERVHAFSASKAQYVTRLRKWHFQKNRSQNDWRILGKKIAKRNTGGKISDIYMNNKLVPKAKVQRQIARYRSPPTFVKNFQVPSPRTPEGFTIRTPEAEAIPLLAPIWTNNLPFFQLVANIVPEYSMLSTSTKSTELQKFIDPRVLHIFDDNAPASVLENRSRVRDLLPDVHPYPFGQIGHIHYESIPNLEQLVAMLKSLLPKSVLDSHLAVLSSLTPPDEGLKSIFSRAMIFSAANSFVHFHGFPMNMTECLRFSMDTGILQSLQHTQGPEFKALAENLFLAAIEAEDAGFIKFLLLNTGLDCNKLICFVQGRRYAPVERSSQLRSIEVTKHLINAQADVNKTYKGVREYGGALELAVTRQSDRSRVDLKLEHMLLQAGAEVSFGILVYAIRRADLDLAQLLILSRVETSRDDWIERGILEEAIKYLDTQSATDIVTSIIQADACSAIDIPPAWKMGLMVALDTAVERGSLGLVRLLLSSGAPITTETLNLALKSRQNEMVRFLLSFGAHPTQDDLNTAVEYGDDELVKLILSSGVCQAPETLRLAVKSGSKELVQSLLEAGADADSLPPSGITPLAEAIRSKDGQIVEFLGLKGAWSRITERPRFRAALEAASEVGDLELVRHLLSIEARFEVQDLWMPLRAAIRANHETIAEILLDAGPEVELGSRLSNGVEPLLVEALEKRNPNLVRLILEADADVNEVGSDFYDGSYFSVTALQKAVEWGDHTIVEDLITRGANIGLSGALITSVQKKDAKIVRILLNAGANANERYIRHDDEAENTALFAAVENCDIEITEILLAYGADPKDSNALLAAMLFSKPLFEKLLEEFEKLHHCRKQRFGSGALAIAVILGGLKLIEKLLASGLDPNTIVENVPNFEEIRQGEDLYIFESKFIRMGRLSPEVEDWLSTPWPLDEVNDTTPLGLAIKKDKGKNILIVQKLLEAGGDPNSIVRRANRIVGNTTALLAAIETKSLPMVLLLINAGAEVNRPAAGGVKRTPLQKSAELGCFDIVQSLLNENAVTNAIPAAIGGGTALQLAAIGGWIGIAELLLNWGADPNAPASKVNGRNAVEGAAEHGRIDMLRLLFNAGAKIYKQLFERSCSLAEKNGHIAAQEYLEYLYLESRSWVDSLDI